MDEPFFREVLVGLTTKNLEIHVRECMEFLYFSKFYFIAFPFSSNYILPNQ